MSQPLRSQREQFSLPRDVHYLNCAYMGPLSLAVQQAGIEGIRRKANPALITPDDFFTESDEARAVFARLVNAPDPQRIAILPSVSYAIATAARNLACKSGQNIVITGEQFPSNVYGWRKLARERKAELRTVNALSRSQRGAGWNEAVLEAIDENTAIVAIPHVHWTDGTRFDVERIGRRARSFGAALVIDGTQSVGALPFDVQLVQPDVLVCAAYKWLLGPYSLAFAYYSERLDGGEPLEEGWITRSGSDDFRAIVEYHDEHRPGAIRYDMGERSNFILLPMAIAAMNQIMAWQPVRIQAYCRNLMKEAIPRMQALGLKVEQEDWRSSHLFGLRMPAGIDLPALHAHLRSQQVYTTMRGSALRIAPHVYNDEADVEALLAGLTTFV